MYVENMTTLEDLMFFPVIGRIYTSEHFPSILKDDMALELREKLPDHLKGRRLQNQYAALAGAVRSANFDRTIREFLKRNPDGIVVQLACGLETAFYRCDNGRAMWLDVDAADSMKIRRTILRESDRERYAEGDPLHCDWLARIRADFPDTPVLVTAGGLLHRFPAETVDKFLWELQAMGNVEIVFDALNRRGSRRMAGYLSSDDPAKAKTPFCVEDAQTLAAHLGGGASVLLEEGFFSHVDLTGIGFLAKSAIRKATRGNLMKTVVLQL